MKIRIAFAALLLSLGVAHAAPVEDVSRQWADAWNAKNLDVVMRLYAPDAVFMPTVGPRWSGLAEIRVNFAGLLKKYNPHVALHSLASEASGTLAYDSGTYEETITPVNGDKAISAKGSYLFVYHRQRRGGWKLIEQSWTELSPVNL